MLLIQIKKNLKIYSISLFFILILVHPSFSLKINNFKFLNGIKNDLKCSDNNAKNSIILLIGDGMGYEHLKLARWVELGKSNLFSMEKLPLHLNVTTFSADNSITDSAAAATAMATGNKTNNGMLSVSPLSEPLETILEISQEFGKSTGIITTTAITHATPAAFMTHVKSRSNTTEISRQIIENSSVNILLGGGADHFDTTQLMDLGVNGYTLIENRSKLMSADANNLFALFAPNHLPYEINRDPDVIPSLLDMTVKAIEILSQDPNGFFLMVEGGRIDHAGHANNKTNVALETIEFHYAVDAAISYAEEHDNIMLIVTADHETGGLTILNETLNDTIPSSNRTVEENRILRIERINNISVSWSTGSHTSQNVPFFGYGTDFYGLNNLTVIDNTEIFDIMKEFISEGTDNEPDFSRIILIGVGITSFSIGGIVIIVTIRNKKQFKKKKKLTIGVVF
ncbi:MAG: alkaline phosphatase [Promethearchaeota archaeon]